MRQLLSLTTCLVLQLALGTFSRALGAAVCTILLLTQANAAEFYKSTSPNGTVSFSDFSPRSGIRKSYRLAGAKGNRGSARVKCVDENSVQMRERIAQIDPAIQRYSKQYQVDANLVRAIARVESCFDREAISRVGAQGLMQLMPKTAAAYGVSDPFDIHQNIRAGAQYFSELQHRFNDTKLSLAAYNAGPTAVDKHKGIPPYPETRKYVKLVLKQFQSYKSSN